VDKFPGTLNPANLLVLLLGIGICWREIEWDVSDKQLLWGRKNFKEARRDEESVDVVGVVACSLKLARSTS